MISVLGNQNTHENKMFMFTGLELQLNFTAHEVYPQPPHLRAPLGPVHRHISLQGNYRVYI